MTSTEFDVRVVPGARRSEVMSYSDGVLRVRVAAPATEQRANRELERYLAELLDVRPRRVEVVGGQRARIKRVRVDGFEAGELRRRLVALAPLPSAIRPDDLPVLYHEAK